MQRAHLYLWLCLSSVTAVGILVAMTPRAALADPQRMQRLWHEVTAPADGAPQAIGAHAAGCLLGGEALPAEGTGYRVAHPDRQRHFGHPQLVDFVRTLGTAVETTGQVLGIHDLAQPRGGPTPTGHASHQTGLDVDIWYGWQVEAAERAETVAGALRMTRLWMVDPSTRQLTPHWNRDVAKVLELAAADPRVERIFVNPVIKRALCDGAGSDRTWLRKVRPWWGHDEHFHVRLHCPADSRTCRQQKPLPAGDGCDRLAWWFRDEGDAARSAKQKRYQSRVGAHPPLPVPCRAVLDATESDVVAHR